MIPENLDYDVLKKKGFLKQKQDGFFVLKVRMPHGVFNKGHLDRLSEISDKFGRGFVHTTMRQGIEIPYIKYEDIEHIERALIEAGIDTGASGPRLRTTTTCPGTNWCKFGLIDTFALYDRIEDELKIKCGLELPHKFKIAISGCPNGCTRPQHSEIGIHGAVDTASKDKRIGYVVYLGGCGGRDPHIGFKLERVLSEDEALAVVKEAVGFYKQNAKSRQRLTMLIEEVGKEGFLNELKQRLKFQL